MRVKDYIVYETERQSGTLAEAVGMTQAWVYMRGCYEDDIRLPLEIDALVLANLINGTSRYRKVPVVFVSGGGSVHPDSIPQAMSRLFEAVAEPAMWKNEQRDGTSTLADAPSRFAKDFLEIHPFADGNGRVASLLWNWMRGTVHNPKPMPYFFGEQ